MKKLVSLIFILSVSIAMFKPLIALGDSTNLALNKPTTQSSDAWGGSPNKAVDGNTNGNFGGSSVTHTNSEANPWWEVDLGSVKSIHTIRIWNRTDCCADRLNNYYVYVSDTSLSSPDPVNVKSYLHSGTAPTTTDILVNTHGRYVRVQIPGNAQTLSLAEVEVLQSSDSIAPTGSIAYSSTVLTNEAVVATLSTSEAVTITNNGGASTFTFESNGSFTFEFIDGAGNTGSAVAAVSNIDRTAPVTTDDAPESIEGEVTVTLTASDDSDVAATYYQLNNGDILSGTSILITGERVHELRYWSVDNAGNEEIPKIISIHVLAPTLSSLSLSEGKLAFHKDITLYTIIVPSNLSSLTLTPVATSSLMTFKINGQAVSNSTSSIPLETGGNKITVELIDSNGETMNTYSIMVLRPLSQLWDIGDTVRAILSEFDINNDSIFTVQDVSGLLGAIESIQPMNP